MEVRKRKRTLRNLAEVEDFQGNLKQTMFTKEVPTEAKKTVSLRRVKSRGLEIKKY